MKLEVKSAVDFLSNILKASTLLTDQQIEYFNVYLQNLLKSKYENHWFPEKPCKGSGFRCIRINHNLDPLIKEAGKVCGIGELQLCTVLPKELTMWVDPRDVSYRIGENGSIGILYDSEQQQHDNDSHLEQNNSNVQLSSSSPSSPEQDSSNKNLQSCKEQLMNISMDNKNLNGLKQLAALVYS